LQKKGRKSADAYLLCHILQDWDDARAGLIVEAVT
jgi:hypothetical protein